jgi:hypothetical protein
MVDNGDADSIPSSVTDSQSYAGETIALLGDEIISFTSFTPTTGTKYMVEGVYRGRLDTDQTTHSADESFWFLGTQWDTLEHSQLIVGSTRKFKFVPINRNNTLGSVDDASEVSIDIDGRAKTPYEPVNLVGNTDNEYTTSIELFWSPRVREAGSGIGDPTWVSDSPITTEGYFKIKSYIGGSLVNTISLEESELTINSDSVSYVFDQATIEGWNGGTLPASVTFEVSNFITYLGQPLESDPASVIVNKV